MYSWTSKQLKALWRYIYDSAANGRLLAATFACLGSLIVIAIFSSFFITPKPWSVQVFHTLIGIFSGGTIGALIGLVVGGIGIALAGTAIGLAGWLAGALFGATLGGYAGLIASFISNPEAYDFHFMKFLIVFIIALLIGFVTYVIILKIFQKCKVLIKNRRFEKR